MCPLAGPLVGGTMVVHALLVETSDRLVLVDTGMGLDDVRAPSRRLGGGFVALTRPRLSEEDTAARQVERLGFARRDVRDLVVTHLDVDHAGGIPDFPDADVHVHRLERDAALSPRTLNERQRYRAFHFAHGPRWEVHEEDGERWNGFASVKAVADDVLLVPLPGHTRGHSAIAVRAPAGAGVDWYLHAGDAYFNHGELVDPASCPVGLRVFQRVIAVDDGARRGNARRLRELHAGEAGGRVRIFSAHCPTEYARATGSRT